MYLRIAFSLTIIFGLVVMPVSLNAQNAYLTNGFMPKFMKAGIDHTIEVRVRNSAATPLITFRVDWRWNGGAVQQGNWQSTAGITGNQYWPYPHPTVFNVPQGSGMLKVWVVGNGDTDPTNDTLYFPITAIQNWVEKNMLLDAWTATWCPVCPPANLVSNNIANDPRVVVAKHHADDEYSTVSSTSYFGAYGVDFTPAGMIDQGEYGSYTANAAQNQWTAELELRKQGVSPVELSVSTTYNALTRELSVSLDATYTYGMGGEHVLNVMVLEDEVAGVQANAPANYVHQQLVRQVLGGPTGWIDPVAQPPVPGTTYPSNWTWTLPGNVVPENVRVIGMATHRMNGQSYTLNVVSSGPLVVGMDEGHLLGATLRAFPNPTADALFVDLPASGQTALVSLFAVDGRELFSTQLLFTGGPQRLPGVEALPAGAYLLRVLQGERSAERRVLKH